MIRNTTHTKKRKRGPPLKRKMALLKMPSLKRRSEIDTQMTSAHNLYNKDLIKQAIFKTSDTDLSDDLVQTTFLKTLRYLQKGGKINTMRAFLNHVLKGLIIDEYRKKKAQSLDNLLEKGFEPGIDYTEQIINIFDGKKIILLIGQLPKKYKTIIQMRYVRGLSIKEIAALTKQKQNTVSVQSHRGLSKLKVIELNSRQ